VPKTAIRRIRIESESPKEGITRIFAAVYEESPDTKEPTRLAVRRLPPIETPKLLSLLAYEAVLNVARRLAGVAVDK
jgi:hypothetical protein